MRLLTKSLVVVTLVVVAAATQSASAQGRYPYRPATPPISPYFELLREDTGGLPSYQAFLRPEREYRSTLAEALQYGAMPDGYQAGMGPRQIELRRDSSLDGRQLRDELRYRSAFPRASRATAGRFMEYSHFYGTGRSDTAMPPRAPLR